MPTVIILVDNKADFDGDPAGRTVMDVRDYISNPMPPERRVVRIINLSRDYSYLGYGYYASLLAAARGHKVIPAAATLVDMWQRGRSWTSIEDLQETLTRTLPRLKEPPEGAFTLTLFFGQADDVRFERLGRQAFDLFRCPILRIKISHDDKWGFVLQSVKPVPLSNLKRAEDRQAFWAALDVYTRVDWRSPRHRKAPRWSLAMLHDPKDPLGPSDPAALRKFIRVGGELGLAVELVTRKDYDRVAEFDALFIRETTAIDHHTFRFAKKAEDEGMPVIDDPMSIIRCTNKVYLAELLAANKVPAPRTHIIGRRRLQELEEKLPYPVVLKIPDGSFSRGVVKVTNRDELMTKGRELLDESDLILAQEFMPTEFDWRVGVLNGHPVYVSQYLMAKKHWQIYKRDDNGTAESGGFRTLAVEDTPKAVIDVAVKAAKLMGNGLYGVDIKQNDRGVFVIEVNDNPSIDSGVEDLKLKDELYRIILREFIRRLDAK